MVCGKAHFGQGGCLNPLNLEKMPKILSFGPRLTATGPLTWGDMGPRVAKTWDDIVREVNEDSNNLGHDDDRSKLNSDHFHSFVTCPRTSKTVLYCPGRWVGHLGTTQQDSRSG